MPSHLWILDGGFYKILLIEKDSLINHLEQFLNQFDKLIEKNWLKRATCSQMVHCCIIVKQVLY